MKIPITAATPLKLSSGGEQRVWPETEWLYDMLSSPLWVHSRSWGVGKKHLIRQFFSENSSLPDHNEYKILYQAANSVLSSQCIDS